MQPIRWDLEINKDNPWVRFVTKKYNYHNNIIICSSFSFLFKSIFKNLGIYYSNTNHIIGDGNGTNLWTDNLIQNSFLRNLLIGPLPKNALNEKVSSIILHNTPVLFWNLNDFPFPFTPQLKQKKIINIAPPSSTETLDYICWSLTSNGTFYIKTAYQWITIANSNIHNSIPSPNLNWIWHSPYNTREHFFLWQVFHEGLPTSQALYNRKYHSFFKLFHMHL